jgi:hypothetical protein
MRRRRSLSGIRGLSQVISSLILLVSSALLASGTVAYYAMTISTVSLKQPHLIVSDAHIWVNSSGAQAALVIDNIGDSDAVIEGIEVKSGRIQWSSVYQAVASVDSDLVPAQGLNIEGSFSLSIGGVIIEFSQASGSLVIPAGKEVVLYIDKPGSVKVSDVGTIASINLYNSMSRYPVMVYVEVA